MKPNIQKENIIVENFIVHYMLSFKHLCLVTVTCPLLALIICFITAYIFQPDDIHETHCRVYNIIPSISAITGISPQRYLWRISVAFHIGPRFIIAAVHKSYHLNLINVSSKHHDKAKWWLNLAFWLNVLEIGSLCGVTYISNRENYPIHEKLFIIFMVSSLTHMLACIKAIRWVAETNNDLESVQKGLLIKKCLLILSLVSTVGLVTFFLKHRLLCHDMAFSWFAFCEYIIALANMAFHITVILDFPTEHLVVAKGLHPVTKNNKFD
ncbi:post-GPI attachment to proteins factor 2-like [Tribolium madens]|uniref:post-GPI attachment to proteins factor 2-like n=1 Tax=Tribolium madens TaxID=41895 RepID=UPI001CF75631|nr:post-GPI attachment to proteins factor 2-like [Tribolium madens]